MQIISISRGNYSQGKELAELLADKLGCRCLSREDLVEEAIKAGIAIGKLETAMLKPYLFNDRLLREKEHFQAFVTTQLCQRALEGDLVYHGRTGHLLLPGISHVLRTRVVESPAERVSSAMAKLGLSWEKAKKYVEAIDDDTSRWVRTMYGVNWEAAANFDITVNLQQLSLQNAAAALCNIAALPDFQATPASQQTMRDLDLAARTRLALARHEKTYEASFHVSANAGEVLVTYHAYDEVIAQHIPNVVYDVEGLRTLRCTMASSLLLWIQERYDQTSDDYKRIVELAKRWNSAVHLMRFCPGEADSPVTQPSPENDSTTPPEQRGLNGGIEDDGEASDAVDDGGLRETSNALAREGVIGGSRVVCCRPEKLIEQLDREVPYSLVVLGDVFLDKGKAAQLRLSRELAGALTDNLKVPVIAPEDLKKTYMFSWGQASKMVMALALAVLVVGFVFTHQVGVLDYLHGTETQGRLLAAVTVAVLIPLFAYSYGTFTHVVLKWLRVE